MLESVTVTIILLTVKPHFAFLVRENANIKVSSSSVYGVSLQKKSWSVVFRLVGVDWKRMNSVQWHQR